MQPGIRGAIARIEGKLADGGSTRGTGCLVTEELVLTALHVVAFREAQTLTPKAAEFDLIFPSVSVKATIYALELPAGERDKYWDRDSDWILLKCATSPVVDGLPRPLPLSELHEDGGDWETFGFPDSNPMDGLALYDGHVHDCNATHRLPDSGGSVSVLQVFSPTVAQMRIEGLSGAPVIVEGAAVGLLRYTPKSETGGSYGTLYACPIDSVLQKTGDVLPPPDPCFGLPGFARRDFPPMPFVSLHWFTEKEAEIFFGRKQEIRKVYKLLTDDDRDPVVLLYGQTGVGKSSLLDAGLFPRLERYHEVRYVRRDAASTLVETLRASIGAEAGAALADAWLDLEKNSAKPVVVLFDQIDEVYSHPHQVIPNEMEEFAGELAKLFFGSNRPRGRMVLSFRKEWFSDIKKQMDARGVGCALEFVQRLDRSGSAADGLLEAITGVTATPRLMDHYHLQIDPGLADTIANDLLKDQESPIAPTLQILMTNMWLAAARQSQSQPVIGLQHYLASSKEGNLLGHFVEEQLATVSDQEWVESGLALDVLAFHTSELMLAQERNADELLQNYGTRADPLVEELQRVFLLTGTSQDNQRRTTRLCHDTLAPLVRLHYHASLKPGQRARRIIENRVENWKAGSTSGLLDAPLLALVEHGRSGMRDLTKVEEALIDASRIEQHKHELRRRVQWGLGALAVLLIMVVAGIALKEWSDAVKQRDLRELDFALDSSQRFMQTDPGKALMLAIAAVDWSQQVNGDVTDDVQLALSRAVQNAREENLVPLPAGVEGFYGVAFSSGGVIATGGDAIRIWDRHGRPLGGFFSKPAEGQSIRSLAFRADGKMLASSDGTGEIRLWDAQGNAAGGPFGAGEGPRAIAFTPEGDAVASNSEKGLLTVWGLDGKLRAQAVITKQQQSWTNVPVEHKVAVARTEGGEDLIVAAEPAGKVGLWHLNGQRAGEELNAGDDVAAVAAAIAQKDVWISTGEYEGTRKTWAHEKSVSTVADVTISPGANLEAIAGHGGNVTVREVGRLAIKWTYRSRDANCCDLAFEPTSGHLALQDWAPELQILDLETGLDMDSLDERGVIAFSPKQDMLAVAGESSIDFWTLSDGRMQPSSRIPVDGKSAIANVAFSQDGTMIAAMTLGGAVTVWNVSGQQIAALQPAPGGLDPVGSEVRFSSDGKSLLAAALNGLVLWNVSARTGRAVLSNLLNGATAMALRHDAGAIAIQTQDHGVRIVDLTGKDVAAALKFAATLQSMNFSEDGRNLATVENNGNVTVWDLSTGKSVVTMKTATGVGTTKVLFSPDGNEVFIAAVALTSRSASSGNQLAQFPDSAGLTSLAASPDAKILAAAARDGRVHLWHADWRDWLSTACERIQYHSIFSNSSAQDDFDKGDIPHAANACAPVWKK